MTITSRVPETSVVGLRLDDHLPYRLSVAASAVSGLIARAYEDRFGLTDPQWRLICVLAEDPALSQADLGARTGMDTMTVSRAAQGLAKRRLIGRSEHRTGGGAHMLALTREGAHLHSEIAPLALAYEAALIAGLAPSEVATLKRLLSRLQGAALALGGQPAPRATAD